MTTSSPILNPEPDTQLPPPAPGIQTIPNYDQTISTLIAHFASPDYLLPVNAKVLKSHQKSRSKFVQSIHSPPQISPSYAEYRKAAIESSKKHPEDWRPLTDWEKWFLTKDQFGRFLRAVKGDEFKALERTEVTTTWRREYGVDQLTEDVVEEESKTGKQMVLGHDFHRRPCLYMFPYRQNTQVSPRQIQFVVWTLERAIDLMPAGVENLCLMIDFGSGYGGGGQPTTPGQARKVLEILQTYYCERLGRAVCINVPMLFWGFYKLLGPFIDPITKDKIRFNPDVRQLVPPSQLEKTMFKGDLDFEYKHEEFYPALSKLCHERREAQFQRWKALGSKVGEEEWLMKGGDSDGTKVDLPLEEAEATDTVTGLPNGSSSPHPTRRDTASHDIGDNVVGEPEPDPKTIETPEGLVLDDSRPSSTISSRRSSVSTTSRPSKLSHEISVEKQFESLTTNVSDQNVDVEPDLRTPKVSKTPLLPEEASKEASK